MKSSFTIIQYQCMNLETLKDFTSLPNTLWSFVLLLVINYTLCTPTSVNYGPFSISRCFQYRNFHSGKKSWSFACSPTALMLSHILKFKALVIRKLYTWFCSFRISRAFWKWDPNDVRSLNTDWSSLDKIFAPFNCSSKFLPTQTSSNIAACLA